MAKIIPIHPELLFCEVLPELNPDFIEHIKNKRKNKE